MPLPPSRKKRRNTRLGTATLSLTALMDVFTIILLFLLKSYSAEGDILAADPRLKLPLSTSTEAPRVRLLVQVTPDDIIVDGVRITGVRDALSGKGLLIKPLYKELNAQARKTEFIARRNPAVRFTGELLIQGDRSIPFRLLEKVMYTSGQAGYNGISLAVISRE